MAVAFPERKHSHWDKSILQDLFLFWLLSKELSSGEHLFLFPSYPGKCRKPFYLEKWDSSQYDTLGNLLQGAILTRAGTLPYRKRKSWWGLSYLGYSGSACCCSFCLIPCFTWQWASEENKGINNDHQHLSFLGTPCACTQVLNRIFLKYCLCVCRKETKICHRLKSFIFLCPRKTHFCLCGIWINSLSFPTFGIWKGFMSWNDLIYAFCKSCHKALGHAN